MGNFGKAVRGIGLAARKMAQRAFYTGPKNVPNILAPAMHSAQKRMLRRMTKQYVPPRAMRFDIVRTPMSSIQEGTPVYSPSMGRLLPQRSMKGNFLSQSPGLAKQQPFRPSQFWKPNDISKSFVTNRERLAGTTMPRHTPLVGSRSPLYNKGLK